MRFWDDGLREERGGKDQGVWDGERPGLWEVRIGALGTGEDLNDEGKGLLLLKREGDESYDLVDYQVSSDSSITITITLKLGNGGKSDFTVYRGLETDQLSAYSGRTDQ